jgi:competence protein ComEC
VTIVFMAACWLAGMVIAQAAGIAWPIWLIPAGLCGVGLVVARHSRVWRLALACGLMLALGATRFGASVPRFDEDDLASYNGQADVTITGWIADAPDRRDSHVNLRIRAETISLAGDERLRPVRGLLLAQAPAAGEYGYGDTLSVRGALLTPPEFDTFSYRDYLARQGVYSIMNFAQVRETGGAQGNPVRAWLLSFREKAHQTIIRLLPDPHASLLSGILLGIDSDISPDVRDAFNAVSATHVIVISGSNLAILAGLIQALARRIVKSPGWVTGITIVAVVAYTVFVGAEASVVRAAIMATLGLVATQLGRQTYGLASLSFAAWLMTAINPSVLWDVGFQLSFLATLGLILYVEPLQRLLKGGLSRVLSGETAQEIVAGTSDAFVVTAAAQITTVPIVAYTFERVAVVSLPVNLLIVPAQTPVMVLGGLAVILAGIAWPVGQVLAWGSWLFLAWTIGVVRLFARLPFASLAVNSLSPWAVAGIYALIFGVTYVALQPGENRQRLAGWLRQAAGVKLAGLTGLVAAALLAVAALSLPDGRLRVTFINVGDGAATLIETPGGRQVLVDAGGSGRRLSAALGSEMPFWDRRIDLLILTQPSSRQIAALPVVAARYQFDTVMTNGVPASSQTARDIEEIFRERGIEPVAAQPGLRIAVGDGVTLTVLHTQVGVPADGDDPGEPVVLMLEYGNARLLLPGDLDAQGEAALLRGGFSLDSTALQVPARGDRAVSSAEMLEAVSPQVAVLAVDAGNRSGLPHPETLERLMVTGVALFRTDEHGTVQLVTDGQQMWVKTAR